MTTVADVDNALTIVCEVELLADAVGDSARVDACVEVLTGLLDLRLAIPLQRQPALGTT